MKIHVFFVAILSIAFNIISAQKNRSVVKIGRQVWTTKNLDVVTYRNGDAIPQAKSENDWMLAGKNKEAVWCYYEFNELNGEKFGKLYNWYAINDAREIAPDGFHVPSSEEWNLLCEHLKGRGGCGYCLKSNQGWESFHPKSTNGINYLGFSALPGGVREYYEFRGLGSYSGWWTTTQDRDYILIKTLNGRYDFGNPTHNELSEKPASKEEGYYVRCIKDTK